LLNKEINNLKIQISQQNNTINALNKKNSMLNTDNIELNKNTNINNKSQNDLLLIKEIQNENIALKTEIKSLNT
jgi:hypothetical protein